MGFEYSKRYILLHAFTRALFDYSFWIHYMPISYKVIELEI